MEAFNEIIRKNRRKASRFAVRPHYYKPERVDGQPLCWPGHYVPGVAQQQDIQRVLANAPWPHFIKRFFETTEHDCKCKGVRIYLLWKPKCGTFEPTGIIITDEDGKVLDWCVNTANTRCLARERKLMRSLMASLCPTGQAKLSYH